METLPATQLQRSPSQILVVPAQGYHKTLTGWILALDRAIALHCDCNTCNAMWKPGFRGMPANTARLMGIF